MNEPANASRWGRRRTVLLCLSLAMNVLVVGVLVGAIAFGGRPGPRAALDGPFPMLRALSDDERREFTRIIRSNRETRPERPVKSLQRGRELLQLISAEEFDPARFDALLAEQSRAAIGRAEAGRAALTELLSQMSFEDRQAFAGRLEEVLRRSARDRRKPDDGRSLPR